MLNLLVSIKQVPDTTNIRINPETGTLVREGVPSIINPYDIYALSLANFLKLKYGGKITVITMGPFQAISALKEAAEFFVDKLILLCDRKFAGADTLATSYTLATTIKYLESIERPFDLYLFGKQAIDGDTAQVGPGVATRLGVPVISYVVKVEKLDLEKREIVVYRKIEEGIEIIQAKMPVLLTCEKEVVPIPFSPVTEIIKAAKIEPEVFTFKEPVKFEPERIGLKGSPTRVYRVFTPELKTRQGILISEKDLEKALDLILSKLKEKGIL